MTKPFQPWLGVNKENRLRGAGIADSAYSIYLNIDALKEADAQDKGFLGAAIGIGVVGAVVELGLTAINPFGAAISAGVGWLIEHIGFLQDFLDLVTGDPDEVQRLIAELNGVAQALSTTGEGLAKALNRDVAGWTGPAAEAFQATMKDRLALLDLHAKVTSTAATILAACNAVMAAVRTLVRDLISAAIGDFVSVVLIGLATAEITFGASLVVALEYCVVHAGALSIKLLSKLTQAVQALVRSAQRLTSLFSLTRGVGKPGGSAGARPDVVGAPPPNRPPGVDAPPGGGTRPGTADGQPPPTNPSGVDAPSGGPNRPGSPGAPPPSGASGVDAPGGGPARPGSADGAPPPAGPGRVDAPTGGPPRPASAGPGSGTSPSGLTPPGGGRADGAPPPPQRSDTAPTGFSGNLPVGPRPDAAPAPPPRTNTAPGGLGAQPRPQPSSFGPPPRSDTAPAGLGAQPRPQPSSFGPPPRSDTAPAGLGAQPRPGEPGGGPPPRANTLPEGGAVPAPPPRTNTAPGALGAQPRPDAVPSGPPPRTNTAPGGLGAQPRPDAAPSGPPPRTNTAPGGLGAQPRPDAVPSGPPPRTNTAPDSLGSPGTGARPNDGAQAPPPGPQRTDSAPAALPGAGSRPPEDGAAGGRPTEDGTPEGRPTGEAGPGRTEGAPVTWEQARQDYTKVDQWLREGSGPQVLRERAAWVQERLRTEYPQAYAALSSGGYGGAADQFGKGPIELLRQLGELQKKAEEAREDERTRQR
ncbi:WXG100 family type VII secretion target [Actinokineospora bangkokensis]|uniref:Putative T7SS secretion signal domain-containing protein n=1 Tax=Actinokineospora bangkokensis TaxID=1193682 RepID=A0A1Q9LIH8_9PSEU|nr:WXG100 family type VII secretion target [Actinokineospora bangkokensis]OLR91823.1 hypothetical protein BJP25_23570 [Actinokineospora bangkokensis]